MNRGAIVLGCLLMCACSAPVGSFDEEDASTKPEGMGDAGIPGLWSLLDSQARTDGQSVSGSDGQSDSGGDSLAPPGDAAIDSLRAPTPEAGPDAAVSSPEASVPPPPVDASAPVEASAPPPAIPPAPSCASGCSYLQSLPSADLSSYPDDESPGFYFVAYGSELAVYSCTPATTCDTDGCAFRAWTDGSTSGSGWVCGL